MLKVYQKNNNIKIKCEIDGKINPYPCCFDCGFNKFETIDRKELNDLLKVPIIYIKRFYCIV